MSDSKRGKVRRYINRAMRETAAEMALNNPDCAPWMKANWERMGCILENHTCDEVYRFKELADIFAWKQPKEPK